MNDQTSAEPGTVADIVRHHARTRPDQVAMTFNGHRTTYRELDTRASRVAQGLIAEGVGPQERVAFLDRNSDQYFEILFGAAKANAVPVAVNWRLAPPEITYILNDARARVLFVGPDFAPVIAGVRDALEHVRRIVVMGPGTGDWPSYEAWRDAQPADDPLGPVGADDVALQMYTSGTTGHPKGVQLAHHGFVYHPQSEEEEWSRWAPGDICLLVMPLFHIGGSALGIATFYHGAHNVVLADFDPGAVIDAIADHRISKLFLVPAALQAIIRHPKATTADLTSIDYVAYGAAPIPLPLLKEALSVLDCGFVQVYGMTEAGGGVAILPPDDHDPAGNKRMRSAGRAMVGREICVMDAEGNRLPPGEIGEICVRAATTMVGYWNRPEATARALDRDGWLRTGDAGYLDEDGYIFLHDRIKDMIVSGGENVYPAEVEHALAEHPGVADVAVIGVPSDAWGEEVKAIVVRRDGADVDEGGLIDYAREAIAGYKVPKSVDFVDALPRNPTGKVLKRVLREPYWQGVEREIN